MQIDHDIGDHFDQNRIFYTTKVEIDAVTLMEGC